MRQNESESWLLIMNRHCLVGIPKRGGEGGGGEGKEGEEGKEEKGEEEAGGGGTMAERMTSIV